MTHNQSNPTSSWQEAIDQTLPCDCRFTKGFAHKPGDPCTGCWAGTLKQAINAAALQYIVGEDEEVYMPVDHDNYIGTQRTIGRNQMRDQQREVIRGESRGTENYFGRHGADSIKGESNKDKETES